MPNYTWLTDPAALRYPISGAMGEGMGMGGNMGPPPCPPPPCPPPPSPPAAIPAVVGSPAGALGGSSWVEGAEFHHINATGVEYQGTGVSISTPAGALPGSYSEEVDDILYIDASGVERSLHKTSLGIKPTGSRTGSNWINPAPTAAGRQHHWVTGTSRFQWWNGF